MAYVVYTAIASFIPWKAYDTLRCIFNFAWFSSLPSGFSPCLWLRVQLTKTSRGGVHSTWQKVPLSVESQNHSVSSRVSCKDRLSEWRAAQTPGFDRRSWWGSGKVCWEWKRQLNPSEGARGSHPELIALESSKVIGVFPKCSKKKQRWRISGGLLVCLCPMQATPTRKY